MRSRRSYLHGETHGATSLNTTFSPEIAMKNAAAQTAVTPTNNTNAVSTPKPTKKSRGRVLKGTVLAVVATCAIAAGDAFAIRMGDRELCLECPNGCNIETVCTYAWWDFFGIFGSCKQVVTCR